MSTSLNPYVRVDGKVFGKVVDENGQDYTFREDWRCTAFADANHPRIPKKDENYVFSISFLQDILSFLFFPNHTALWLTGPTGCGKTSGILQVASRLNWPVIDVTLNNRFEFADLRGQWGMTQEQGESQPTMKYLHNALAQAMREGYILILNEVDLASPGELSALNDVIEGRNLLISENQGEQIKPHPMFRLVVTGNSNGSGDDSGLYQGIQQQNVAAMDRYRIVHVDYPSISIEKQILSQIAPSVPEEIREQMCSFAQHMREIFVENTDDFSKSISVPFSTRTLVNWATNLPYYTFAPSPLKKVLELFFLGKLSKGEKEIANNMGSVIFGEAWK